MTTTMLSSSQNKQTNQNKLSLKEQFFHLYLTTIKQNIGPALIYGICMILAVVLPTFGKAIQLDGSNFYFFRSSLSFALIGFIAPVLMAAMLFHYLHDRLSIDFYHSMPISRKKLFLSKYFAGLSLLLAPLVVTKILCFIIHVAFFYPSPSIGVLLLNNLSDLFFWASMYIVVFTVSCMVAVTSSNVMESILYSIGLNGLLGGLLGIFIFLVSSLPHITFFIPIIKWICPYTTMVYYVELNMYADSISAQCLIAAAIWLLISVGVLFLTLRFYQHYQSEWAQMWGRQSMISQIMKVAAGLMMMTIFFYIKFLGNSNNIPNALLASLVGAPLGFLIVEGITGKGFSGLYKNRRYIALTLCLSLISPLIFITNGFGAVSRIPSVDRIQKISLSEDPAFQYSYYYYPSKDGSYVTPVQSKKITLTSPRSKEIITELHQRGIVGNTEDPNTGYYMSFDYQLSPFKTQMQRYYSFSYHEIPLILELICQPEYIQQSEPVFHYSPSILDGIEVYDKGGKLVYRIPAEHYEQLLETLRADMLTMSGDRLMDSTADPTIGYLSFFLKEYNEKEGINLDLREEFRNLKFDSSSLILRSSYHNTLALLKEWNAVPQNHPSSSIKEIVVSMPFHDSTNNLIDLGFSTHSYRQNAAEAYDTNLRWTISDPELIDKIYSASSLHRTSAACNQVFIPSTQDSYYSKLFIENDLLLSILKDSNLPIPYLLSDKEMEEMQHLKHSDEWVDKPTLDKSHYPSQITGADLFQVSKYTSVAEFARQNSLDWFSGKTEEQLSAMENTALLLPDGALIFYTYLITQP